MATNATRFSLVRMLLRAKQSRSGQFRRKGFTLIELLVAIIVGSLIVGVLLYVVVELLQINRREEILTQTQQDMRRAIDYMSRDISEAIFVYASPDAVTDELTDLPANTTPVLAFWRLDPVDTSGLNCGDLDGDELSECTTLLIRQSMYTLVVYLHADNSGNDIWSGPARIIRYELPKYTAGGINALNQRTGYLDPSIANNFDDWTRNPDDNTTDGVAVVLTDHVDAIGVEDDPQACPGANYVRSPEGSDSFFACVLAGDVANPDTSLVLQTRTNQSVQLALRGNTETNAGQIGLAGTSEASRLPTLETEVLIRGVVQKQPGS